MSIMQRISRLEERAVSLLGQVPVFIFGDGPVPPGIDPSRVIRFRWRSSQEQRQSDPPMLDTIKLKGGRKDEPMESTRETSRPVRASTADPE